VVVATFRHDDCWHGSQCHLLGLDVTERWNSIYNPEADTESPAGATNWLTVGALVLSLLVGTTALLSTLAYGFQRYFETQIEEARKISQ